MKQADKQGAKNRTGALGETIVVRYLTRKGFEILDTSYLKKWGEIDVIAKLGSTVHFVEVKTVSYETKQALEQAISQETYRPEENAHPKKLQKVARTAETWVSQHKWLGDWQLDVAAVRIVPSESYATIRYIDNVILE